MAALKTSIVSLALCSLFASSLVHADDCSDALMAESCACRSQVRSSQERLRTSDTGSTSDRQAKARKKASVHVAPRAKKMTAVLDAELRSTAP
jgi:hypothetical protein